MYDRSGWGCGAAEAPRSLEDLVFPVPNLKTPDCRTPEGPAHGSHLALQPLEGAECPPHAVAQPGLPGPAGFRGQDSRQNRVRLAWPTGTVGGRDRLFPHSPSAFQALSSPLFCCKRGHQAPPCLGSLGSKRGAGISMNRHVLGVPWALGEQGF